MRWLGATIGFILGSMTRIRFGGIIGASIGWFVEDRLRNHILKTSPAAVARERAFLAAMATLMAKLAKADGRIDASEIAVGEQTFRRLGLTPDKRAFCITVFRDAKNDPRTIYAVAEAFARDEPDSALRSVLYDILWDMACADGVVTIVEDEILARITASLGIDPVVYQWQRIRRGLAGANRSANVGAQPNALADAYATLGCAASASDKELKAAYREKAKKYHPDVLRARGLPPELIKKANEQMARVNAAWTAVRRARGL